MSGLQLTSGLGQLQKNAASSFKAISGNAREPIPLMGFFYEDAREPIPVMDYFYNDSKEPMSVLDYFYNDTKDPKDIQVCRCSDPLPKMRGDNRRHKEILDDLTNTIKRVDAISSVPDDKIGEITEMLNEYYSGLPGKTSSGRSSDDVIAMLDSLMPTPQKRIVSFFSSMAGKLCGTVSVVADEIRNWRPSMAVGRQGARAFGRPEFF
jgi:hypothetical protein